MVNPFRRANLPWLGVQAVLFIVFVVLAQAVPVSGSTRLVAAIALSSFFKWVFIANWENRRHASPNHASAQVAVYATDSRMPKSIVLFERFAYLALILGLVALIINWPVISKRPQTSPAFLALTGLISIAIQVFLIRRIVRRRNWARWTFIALIFFGTASAIAKEFVHPWQLNGVAGNAAYYLCYVVPIVAAYFLLTSQAQAWFRLSAEEAPLCHAPTTLSQTIPVPKQAALV